MPFHIPEALVEDILLLLPAIALVRLRSVCKSWHSLIQTHSFILSHIQHSLSNPLILIRHSSKWSLCNTSPFSSPHIFAKIPPSNSPIPPSYSLRFVQSLHGLVCLTEQIYGKVYAITLWNPSICRYVGIKLPTRRVIKQLAIGFGFDSNNHDYKLIRILRNTKVQLYSLNKGFWRVLDVSYTRELEGVNFSDTQCFFNGNVHWIVARYDPSNKIIVLILMFNVEEEKFNRMQLPPELFYGSIFNLKVTVIEGCLSVLQTHVTETSVHYADIWMMREYGVFDSWTKICKVHFKEGIDSVIGLSTSAKVLVLLSTELERREREWGLQHSFDTNSLEITYHIINRSLITASEYTGSLVLLDRKTDGISCHVNMSRAIKRKHDRNYYSFPKLSSTSTIHPGHGVTRLI